VFKLLVCFVTHYIQCNLAMIKMIDIIRCTLQVDLKMYYKFEELRTALIYITGVKLGSFNQPTLHQEI